MLQQCVFSFFFFFSSKVNFISTLIRDNALAVMNIKKVNQKFSKSVVKAQSPPKISHLTHVASDWHQTWQSNFYSSFYVRILIFYKCLCWLYDYIKHCNNKINKIVWIYSKKLSIVLLLQLKINIWFHFQDHDVRE